MATELQEKEKNLVNDSGPQNGVGGKTQNAAQRLDVLLAGTGAQLSEAQGATLIRNVACDSRKAKSQGLFFALQGAKEDGAKFARDAVSRGAMAVVSEAAAPPLLPDSIAWMNPFRSTCTVCRIFRSGFLRRTNSMRPSADDAFKNPAASVLLSGKRPSRPSIIAWLRPHDPACSLMKGLPSSSAT